MMVKHISIEVTSKQTKKPVFGGPADLLAFPYTHFINAAFLS